MHRFEISYLKQWVSQKKRKPLIIRGARQVGKTTLVELFAKEQGLNLVTINFEVTPEIKELFSNNPQETINQINIQLQADITPGKTILFLDEIQQAPAIIANLRYFFEKLPQLHVIAAGSLLEFALKEFEYSMPVGRIEYLYLGPLTFNNFLHAIGETKALDFITSYKIGKEIPNPIHEKLIKLVKTFLVTGGMPESVDSYIEDKTFAMSEKAKHSILKTYQDDFNKYPKKVNVELMRTCFNSLPNMIGTKIKYSNITKQYRSASISSAIENLSLAKIVHKIHHTSSNGVPLGAEISDKIFKTLFLDVGLVSTALNINYLQLKELDSLKLINAGPITEQFIGQQLLYNKDYYIEPSLYYWCREHKSSNSEVDYIISYQQTVIPIEVKAGKTGTLRSLHQFMQEKNRHLAVRFNSDLPNITNVETTINTAKKVNYKLISLPLYFVSELDRLIAENI